MKIILVRKMDIRIRNIVRWLQRRPFKNSITVCNDVRDLDSGIYRNMPCVCGSGSKYKHCCMPNIAKTTETQLAKKLTEKDIKYYQKKYKEKTSGLDSRTI